MELFPPVSGAKSGHFLMRILYMYYCISVDFGSDLPRCIIFYHEELLFEKTDGNKYLGAC